MNERPWQSNLWQTPDTVPHPKAYEVIPAYLLLEDGQVTRGIIFQASHNGCTGIHFGTVDQEILHGVRKWQPVLGLGGRSSADRLPVEEEIFNDLVKPHGWTSMEYAPQGNITSWILTTHGKVEEAKCYLDEKNRPYWGPDEGCRLKAVAWKQRVHGGEKPERPDRKTGRWPDEVRLPAEHVHSIHDALDHLGHSSATPISSGGGSECGELKGIPWSGSSEWGELQGPGTSQPASADQPNVPITVVIDSERDLHLRLPNGPWQPMSKLPIRLEEGDEDLVSESVWVLLMDGGILVAKGRRRSRNHVTWRFSEDKNGRELVAWAPLVDVTRCPERPLLYHAAGDQPVTWDALKWPQPWRQHSAVGPLNWLADLLENIVPPLARAFREEPPAKAERPTAEDVNRHLHEELKEIGELVEAAKTAEPEPVEKSPVDNRDWTQGMYKTANDYDVPPIPGYDELSREHHEGIVRSVLRDLIREKTRDQTLDEYLANFTPMEVYILQGLATGQEHFVDTKGLAAFNYDRLYRSGFITRVPVTFGPRLDRNTRQGMGGGGSGTGNVPSRPYASGGGCGYEVWVLTPLGQQFMAYLLARDNRRYVTKNRSDQSK